jgi:hypothetical protein
MDTNNNDFWDKLVNELQPILTMSEQLMTAMESLCLNHQVDLKIPIVFEDMSPSLQEELGTIIEKTINDFGSFSLTPYIDSQFLYLSMIGQLNTYYQKPNRIDNSTRFFVLNLMEEVMRVSIENRVMDLSDWENYLAQCKEVTKIKNAIGYVYKRVSLDKSFQSSYCIYDFFYNDHSIQDINQLLNQAKESLLLAQNHRNITQKRGQGLSRHIINIVHRWQDAGIVKPMKSVFPFCQLLQKHWNGIINLGSRQGLEATYKQRL